jgi:hypothetical protein
MSDDTSRFYASILDLARRIEAKWLQYNYSTDDFYKVVWEETENFDLSYLADLSNQLDLIEIPQVRFQQHRSTFSDFHFQIFHNGRFLIEILNWSGSHVNIHDHDFSGVQFQLNGDSLNVLYDFNETSRHGAITCGDLKVRTAEIWTQGGRSVVRPGTLDPHTVLHLGSPTVSLLIRTAPTARYGAQLNYFSDLSAYYYVNDDAQRKKLTGLHLLARHSPSAFRRQFQRFIDLQSMSENFFMLLKLNDIIFQSQFTDLLNSYANRGNNENRIVKSVAFHRASEFFKKAGNHSSTSPTDKIDLFTMAASHSLADIEKIASTSRPSKDSQIVLKNFASFISKLDAKSAAIATNMARIIVPIEPTPV